MRAKKVFESIKHLKPRSEEEIKSYLKNLSPKEKLETGAKEGLLWLVKDALSKGADVHAWDDCALRWASWNGHLEVVKVLLDTGADVHANDDLALQLASENGHVEVVKVLLDAGANVHAWDDRALQWASKNGHTEVVKVLLDASANVHADNDLALRWASEEGHTEVVKVLLDAGADVHAENDLALRYASSKGHLEVVKLLKQYRTKKKKRVNESIKHLTGRTQEEIRTIFDKLSALEKLQDYKSFGIKLTNDEKLKLFRSLSFDTQLNIYKNLDIKLSKNEIEEIIRELSPNEMAKFALENSKPDIYQIALDKGHKMSESDKRFIIQKQRYFDKKYEKSSNWNDIIKKYINISEKKKIVDRDPEENKKDYDIAKKKFKGLKGLNDITTEKQETNGTMMFSVKRLQSYYVGSMNNPNPVPVYDYFKFSITKAGYVRRHWLGMFSVNSAPIIENPYLTYSEMADILIKHLYKNNYIK